jgi:HK97 family phage prohead protease
MTAIVHKTYDSHYVRLKASGDEGVVTAVVAVFGNVDLQGDRVVKSAFSKSLQRWAASGDRLPCVWSHEWLDPESHIGYVTSAKETDEGLEVVAKLDIESNPRAAQIFKLLKERRLTEWSFSYDVVRERRAEDGANELLELDLIEVGPALKGANPETRTISAKADHALPTPVHNDPRRFDRALDGVEADLKRRLALEKSSAYWERKIDQAASGPPQVDPAVVKQVDDLVLATRLELIQESIDRAEQAAWEERMLINTVLDPPTRSGRPEDAAGDKLNTRATEKCRFRHEATGVRVQDGAFDPTTW